jgi:hypothetical protein
MMEILEGYLYDENENESEQENGSQDIVEECYQWRRLFPYLRFVPRLPLEYAGKTALQMKRKAIKHCTRAR